jgi:nicotinamidase-related amidase
VDCLILVDLQNDYFSGGRMELVGTAQAATNAQRLLTAFREQSAPIVHVQHISAQPSATFFLPGTVGVEINPAVAPQAGEAVVVKHFPNSFRDTTLHEILQGRGINDLVICGAMSHMCIDATVRAAFDLGFNCVVAEDACATRNLSFKNRHVLAVDVHAAFMAALSTVYAKVTTTEVLLQSRG